MTSTPDAAIAQPNLKSGARLAGCFAILMFAMAVVFGRVAGFEFLIWDDPANVTNNPYLQPASWENLTQFWTASYQRLYVPVAYTILWVEAGLHEIFPGLVPAEGGLNSAVFHLGNLALHTLTVMAVFLILRLVVKQDWAALAGALLFGLHPLQSESVGWITETRGLSSALFGFLAVWIFLLSSGSNDPEFKSKPSLNAVLGMVFSTILFLLSLLAKPTAVVFPLVIFVLMIGWRPAMVRRASMWLLLWIIAGGLCVIGSKTLQPDEIIQSLTPLWTRPFIAGDALAFYLSKTLLPWSLGIDYGRSPTEVLSGFWPYMAWIVPVTLLVALWQLPHRRWWLTAYGVFVVGVIPMLGLVPFRFQDFSTVADRYVYVAMLGPALAVAWFVAGYRTPAARFGVAAMIAIFATLSFIQVGYWRDDRTLYQHELQVNPKSYLAYSLLGKVEEIDGNVNAAAQHYVRAIEINPDEISARNNLAKLLQDSGRYEEAFGHYRRIIEHSPELTPVKMNLAIALAAAGHHEESRALYEEVLSADPDFVLAYINYAELLRKVGELESAANQYRRVLEIEPGNVDALVNLGTLLGSQGRMDEAIELYQTALELRADDINIVTNFGLLLLHSRRAAEAEQQFRYTLELQPTSARLQQQLGEALAAQGKEAEALLAFQSARQLQPNWLKPVNSISWLLSTSNDPQIRDGKKALRLAIEACQATTYGNAEALDTLAAAYAETGDYEKAIETAESARRIASLAENDELAMQINLRIRSYRHKMPHRSP